MPGTIFNRQTMKNRDWKETRVLSKEIIQFYQAMFESNLDTMMCNKVERIVKAMLNAEAERLPTPPKTSEATDGRRTTPATTNANSPPRPAGSDSKCRK